MQQHYPIKKFKQNLLTITLACCINVSAIAGVKVVPERADDLAFENNRVAFRVYGPALQDSAERCGLDCWMKSVSYPIIEKWYALNAEGKSYHKDRGEGYDAYHVGSSLGSGSIALWKEKQLVTANVYQKVEIIKSSPHEAEFKVHYAYENQWNDISEIRHFKLKPDQQLIEVTSQFFKNGKPSKQKVAVGVTTHDGKASTHLSKDQSTVSTWELIHEKGIGTAARVTPKPGNKTIEIKSQEKDKSHACIISETNDAGIITYYVGFAWEGANLITSNKQWQAYLNRVRE